jgi:DNA-directed RNA polymerase subunit RPC12/RpoP
MKENKNTICTKCGQKLRAPKDIGGLTMQCPTCGNRFGSDFRMADSKHGRRKSIVTAVSEFPFEIVSRIFRSLMR